MGGMLGYLVVNQWGVNVWLGCALVVVICASTGYLQDRIIWQPLRRRGLGLAQMMIVRIWTRPPSKVRRMRLSRPPLEANKEVRSFWSWRS